LIMSEELLKTRGGQMKDFRRCLLIIWLIALPGQALGGNWTGNQFHYKPGVGARGAEEKGRFDTGLDRVDARLGKEIWVGDPNYGTTLQGAITAIGSNTVILRVPAGTHTIAADLTIPANVTLKPERGAILSIDTTKTLTLNGGIEAGLYQIFSCAGTGKVVFASGAVKEVYPHWWGAVGNDSVDCSPAFQAAFNTQIPVTLADGVYKITNTIYLNSTDPNFQYVLRGAGHSRIKMYGFNPGYCLIINQNPNGSTPSPDVWPITPRLIVSNLQVDGTQATTPGFIYINPNSTNVGFGVKLTDVCFTSMTYGVKTPSAYVDRIILEVIHWLNPKANSWTVWLDWLGDGFYARNLNSCYVRLGNCRGGHIVGAIGGYYEFLGCNSITMENCHLEGDWENSPGFAALVKISDSNISIKSSLFFDQLAVPPILIDDSGGYRRASHVTLEANTFNTTIFTANTYRQSPDIYINGWDGWSHGTLTLRQNRWISSNNKPFGLVAAASDSGLNSALTACRHLLTDDVKVDYATAGWRVAPLGGAVREFQTGGAPSIGYIGVAEAPSTLSNGTTYYYRCAQFTDVGHTLPSTEVSKTATTNNSIQLSYDAFLCPSILRVWRGTASGNYTAYADIPIVLSHSELRDRGDYLEGFPWITSGIPALPTANTSMSGYLAYGQRVFFAPAAPSTAEFTGIRGDKVINNQPAAGGPSGWMCVTGGTPGTWKAEANLVN
jgi:hypothetical protein